MCPSINIFIYFFLKETTRHTLLYVSLCKLLALGVTISLCKYNLIIHNGSMFSRFTNNFKELMQRYEGIFIPTTPVAIFLMTHEDSNLTPPLSSTPVRRPIVVECPLHYGHSGSFEPASPKGISPGVYLMCI